MDSFDVEVSMQERPTHTFTLNLLAYDRQDDLEDAIKAESDRWLATLPKSLQWGGISVYMESLPQTPHIKHFTLEVNK